MNHISHLTELFASITEPHSRPYSILKSSTRRYFKKIDNPIVISSEEMLLLGENSHSTTLHEDRIQALKIWEELLKDSTSIWGKKSLASTLNVNMNANPPVRSRPFVIGHRGSIYEYPENTIRSFLASYENGCDAIELDVFLLNCGTLVVFHGGGTDENPGLLQDYCNVKGSILDYTAKEARDVLKLNPNYEEFACPAERITDEKHTYIPTLEEVLLTLKGTNMTIKIELKGEGTTVPVLDMVQELNMVKQCHYSSFDHDRIALVRKLHPETDLDGTHVYKTGALFADNLPENFIEKAKDIGASEVHLKYDTCTKERVKQIHEAGMESMCWFRGPIGMREDIETKYNDVGNEDFAMYEVVRQTGVGAMCVNKPNVLVELLSKPNKADEINNIEQIETFAFPDMQPAEIIV